MKKATKEAMRKESTKKERRGRVRAEAEEQVTVAPAVPEPVDPAESGEFEPAIDTPEMVDIEEVPEAAPPAEVPMPVEGADAAGADPTPEMPTSAPDEAAAASGSPAESPAEVEPPVDLDALRKPVEEAKAALEASEVNMRQLVEHARVVAMVARDDYLKALAPYRAACRMTDRVCEFAGGRGANVAERVAFLVEKAEEGVRIMIRGRPETEETIPPAALQKSVSHAAYAYTDKHLGPKEVIGNKGGGLGNRIRAAMK